MRGEWPTIPIGSVATIYDGPHATPPTQTSGPVFLGIDALDNGRLNLSVTRCVSEETFADWTRRVVPKTGDLVFSYETRIGQAALIPADFRCCLGRRLALARADRSRVVPEYLLYYYIAPEFQNVLRANTKPGSTVDRIHLLDFPKFPIVLPPVQEQRFIVKLLSALDDKIALNRRMAGTLEGIARTLFQSWFVDFDHIRGNIAGETPGLSAPLAALFPTALNRDGIPEGWTMGTISKFAAINPKNRLDNAITTPYVDMAALPTSGSRVTRVTQRPAGSGARFTNCDTLIARITPCLENGKTALIDCLSEGAVGWGSTEFIVLRPHANIPRALPYLIARHEPFRAHLIAAMSGTSGRQRVQADAVDRWEIAIPPEPVVSVFGKLVDPIFQRLKVLGEESNTLAALRDTLLPKLISGELRVRDAETITAGV